MGGRHPCLCGRRITDAEPDDRSHDTVSGCLLCLSAWVGAFRGGHHPPDGAGRPAADRIGQYRRDQCPAHRQQGGCGGDPAAGWRQGRGGGADRAGGGGRGCGAACRPRSLSGPSLPGIPQLQGRQGRGNLSGRPAGAGLARRPCLLRHMASGRCGLADLLALRTRGGGKLDSLDADAGSGTDAVSGHDPDAAGVLPPCGQYPAPAHRDGTEDRQEVRHRGAGRAPARHTTRAA
ncbi:UNVERIFIED_CONTAM: hypothetical protein NCL1_05044 [Trichonephila clavipes]